MTVKSALHFFEANARTASLLREAAVLLRAQRATPFRALAYEKAAATIEALDEDISTVVARGRKALDALPHIGPGIAAAIIEIATTGRWSQLERLRGGLEPELSFQAIPGIGPRLASVIHDHLHVDTLDALEVAAHDGRLAQVPGVGPRRAAIVRDVLAAMLQKRRFLTNIVSHSIPPAALILDVDREYREKANVGALPRIAPKRFNPKGRAWLPILHTERGDWQFTALFSNTALSHELGRTNDWVIIYFSHDNQPEGQCTVVTETTGTQKGMRVIRGREKECGVASLEVRL